MGSKPAPSYANIFMDAKVDKKIWEITGKYLENGTIPLKFMKRFLDDLFMVFQGSTQSLHEFIEELDNVHPTVKFTMSHTKPKGGNKCDCEPVESIPFLDTSCQIKDGRIITDLYRKPTDKNQYLLTSSCHPMECFKNIPLSLALRINRICSEVTARELRFGELKEMLVARGYIPSIIEAAIAKARSIPREVALRRVSRQAASDRPTFAVTYNPRLPSIPDITRKHWRSMVYQDKHLENVFPEPPLIAYKRQRNLKDQLVRAKLPIERNRPKREQKGMKKCGKCLACSYIKEGRTIKGNKFVWSINKPLNCKSTNIVYLLECDKQYCRQRYIGQSDREFKERIYEHIGYARNKIKSKATGHHFSLPGHSEKNMKFTIIEQPKYNQLEYREEREKYHIKKFDTFYNGINRTP
jgi:hypothetical protein